MGNVLKLNVFRMKNSIVFIIAILLTFSIWANPEPDKKVVYKKIGNIELSLHFFFPKKHTQKQLTPAILFFHGGGWKGGSVNHFYNQSAYLASRGIIGICAQYRVENQHGTTPKEVVKDVKSAMRWVKMNASKYGIDPDKILAGGGSAGGHAAAATATLEGFNEDGEDTSIDCIPKALVLFNPVANNGPDGYGYDRVKAYWQDISPYHNINEHIPPTLIMLGTKDNLFTIAQAKQYKEKIESFGKRCDLKLYEDQDHAFFNLNINKEMHFQTMYDADVFLTSLGYLKGKPTVNKFRKTIDEM